MLLAELMGHDDFNLASGVSLFRRLHFQRRELLSGMMAMPEGPLRYEGPVRYLNSAPATSQS